MFEMLTWGAGRSSDLLNLRLSLSVRLSHWGIAGLRARSNGVRDEISTRESEIKASARRGGAIGTKTAHAIQ